MKCFLAVLGLASALFMIAPPAEAQLWEANALVRVCPAAPDDAGPPEFAEPACKTAPYWLANPQNRTVWIEARIELDAAPDPLSGPYALFLSGKMAARAWVNEAEIGANGAPAFSAEAETPGRMDAAIFLPAQLMRAGENQVVLLASGHHSLIELTAPIHRLAVGPYGDPRRPILQSYQASLAMFGVFALAFAYFAVLTVLSPRRMEPGLLAALALFAGLQLLAETGRGLFAYTYPIHDVRLIALAAGAAGLAAIVTLWSVMRFAPGRRIADRLLLAGLAAAVLLALVLAPGFDQKAGYSLFFGATAAAAPPAWSAVRTRAAVPAIWGFGFLAVAASAFIAPQSLLDRTVFFALAALLLVNIAGEARRFVAERAARLSEARRADALAAALARAEQGDKPVQIALVSAGRTDYANAAEIARLNAADDYVEVVFKDGRTMLHTGALAKLEARLPASFLRVHRSCIVNTDEIAALERDAGGSGRLILKHAGEAPVSRRILPKVRRALEA
ncbi:MAG: LytTR family DNA-binding domain-containing protein [Oceanicaulis sp.]